MAYYNIARCYALMSKATQAVKMLQRAIAPPLLFRRAIAKYQDFFGFQTKNRRFFLTILVAIATLCASAERYGVMAFR